MQQHAVNMPRHPRVLFCLGEMPQGGVVSAARAARLDSRMVHSAGHIAH